MVSTKKAIQAKTISNSLTDLIIDCITDIKGKNIILLNLKATDDAPADYFIVCEGDSTTQVRAISQNIERRLKDELRLHPAHVEGTQHAKWVCMDYFDIVVHIFHPETRRFYDLEQLWSDAEMIEYQNV
ncbi:MAG TPA: ribosome silencing factor [Saprospiraceae bacterium]|nr:ribosome silencing factor [Saprospiraceae bacterium]